ncbi:MAG: His-Xaa-Ser system protein HxsD [Nannocystaceae bacterium]|nr:His-Xaa-Ser system protein HxsD [Nannocystaceae bacterium]
MDEALTGLPPQVTAELGDAAVTLVVPAALYPRDALYGAAYVFIDRCFVVLGQPSADEWSVTLAKKDPTAAEPSLREIVGEFANELLSCAWRSEITQSNRAVIETVTMQAFAGAMGPPSLDELEAFDFTDEPFDDPLGIAQSWEDKYKKKKPGSATDVASDETPDKTPDKTPDNTADETPDKEPGQ